MKVSIFLQILTQLTFAYPSHDIRVGTTWRDRVMRKNLIQSARRAGRNFEEELEEMSADELIGHAIKARQMRKEWEARQILFLQMLQTVNEWGE